MKAITLYASLAVLCALMQNASAFQSCRRPFEVYQSCGNPCQSTCTNLFVPPRICPSTCVPGCYCRSGYLRNHLGFCVPVSSCAYGGYRQHGAHHVRPFFGAGYGPHSYAFSYGPHTFGYGHHVTACGPHAAPYGPHVGDFHY